MRLNFLVVCLSFMCYVSFSVMAADNTQTGTTAANKNQTKSAKSAEKGVEKMIAGMVASVNIEKNEITVQMNSGSYPILIDGSTRIIEGNNQITMDKIKAGDRVSINYLRFSDGSRIALNIDAKSYTGSMADKSSKKMKAESKKEASAAKAEVNAEQKKDAAAKAEVNAEQKKDAAAKAKVNAEQKRETAAKTEVKAEQKKDAAAKAEVKAEQKKDTAAKAEVKVESKKDTSATQPAKVAN
jgi:hypothetical protein